jgi:hypothetical protein
MSTGGNQLYQKNMIGTTNTSVFNKTDDNFMMMRREPSIDNQGDNQSCMSTINGGNTQ